MLPRKYTFVLQEVLSVSSIYSWWALIFPSFSFLLNLTFYFSSSSSYIVKRKEKRKNEYFLSTYILIAFDIRLLFSKIIISKIIYLLDAMMGAVWCHLILIKFDTGRTLRKKKNRTHTLNRIHGLWILSFRICVLAFRFRPLFSPSQNKFKHSVSFLLRIKWKSH